MSAQIRKQKSDAELIATYTDQPPTLPIELRVAIEARLDGDPIQLYAMTDLDAAMNLSQIWVALGPRHVVIAQAASASGTAVVTSIERNRVKAVAETPGLSCTVLTLLGDASEPALAVLRYTHRQRRAMENIKFILEQQLAGYDVDTLEADSAYATSVAQAIKDAQAAVAGHHLAVLWRLLSYLQPYRLQLGLGMLAATVMTALSLVPPFVTKYLIDDIVQPFAGGSLAMEQAMTLGWIVIGGLALTYLAVDACHWVRLRLMSTVGEFVARDLRRELYEHLQTLSLSFYSRKQTGSIISRVSHDTDRLWDFVAFGIVEVTLSILTLIGLSVVLLALDWRLGLVMVLPVPLLIFSFMVHSRTLKRLFLRAWRKWSGLTEVISDTVPGMHVVKAFNQERREVNRFNERNDNALLEFNSLHTVWTRFWPAVILSLHVMAVGVWAFALPRLLSGPEAANAQLSFGTFIAFLLYMGMFMYPIETIGMMTRMMNRATSSAMRIFEVLDTEPEIRDVAMPVKLEPVTGRVTFENVAFAYDGIRQVLKGVSFDVAPGEMIGLVGKSGSGKTTVTNLIARFYEPSSGRISIDGADIRRLDTGHYRRQLGMVLQDPHLFHGTVLSNIRYGAPAASLEDVIEAARAANAHDFICQLPHGYDTVVGERGHTLSGGERQRVSIARAVLNNPRILILDEATSSVDTETERKIQEALERLIQGRTVFAVAHRLSTLRRASRLLVLDDGSIEEEGTHAELLRKDGGIYRRLHELQRELHEMYAV